MRFNFKRKKTNANASVYGLSIWSDHCGKGREKRRVAQVKPFNIKEKGRSKCIYFPTEWILKPGPVCLAI